MMSVHTKLYWIETKTKVLDVSSDSNGEGTKDENVVEEVAHIASSTLKGLRLTKMSINLEIITPARSI